MSRLAALKEFTFMKALKENGFPVPEPVAQSRHTIVMELIDAFPLRQITEVPDPPGLYAELIDMILRLARVGLIHGDFNEFNILIKEESGNGSVMSEAGNVEGTKCPESSTSLVPIIIDFPQMVSMDHPNAAMYFDRDVNCIKRFFDRRFHFTSHAEGPLFSDVKKSVGKGNVERLDVQVEASGFSRKMAKELETYMQAVGVTGEGADEHQDEGIVGSDDKHSSGGESDRSSQAQDIVPSKISGNNIDASSSLG